MGLAEGRMMSAISELLPLIGLLLRLALIASTLGVLWIGTRSAGKENQRRVDGALVLLALLSLGIWMNWSSPQRPSLLHIPSVFHYYLSSKYFHEIGYFNLYGAALIADREDPPEYFYQVEVVRDLRDYKLVSPRVLREDRHHVERFTPERWAAFKADLAVMQRKLDPEKWRVPLRDHGNNGPPAQAALSGIIANLVGPATGVSLQLLALIDPLTVLVLFYVVYRVRSLRTSALAAIFFGMNELCDYGYITGAFLRLDWLVATAFGICALKAHRDGLAGFFLGVATMMRVFPVFFAFAVVLHGVVELVRTRTWPTRHVRFAIGLTVGAIPLFLLSLGPELDPQPWFDFVDKISIHLVVQATNIIGLRQVVAADSLLMWALRAAITLLFLFSLPRVDALQAGILGGALVLAFVTIADYYYGFLLIFVLWQPWERADGRSLTLLGLFFLSASIVPVACRAVGAPTFQYRAATLSLLVTFAAVFAQLYFPSANRGDPGDGDPMVRRA